MIKLVFLFPALIALVSCVAQKEYQPHKFTWDDLADAEFEEVYL